MRQLDNPACTRVPWCTACVYGCMFVCHYDMQTLASIKPAGLWCGFASEQACHSVLSDVARIFAEQQRHHGYRDNQPGGSTTQKNISAGQQCGAHYSARDAGQLPLAPAAAEQQQQQQRTLQHHSKSVSRLFIRNLFLRFPTLYWID